MWSIRSDSKPCQELANKHLIDWGSSKDYELAAEEVLCITPNLHWAYVYRKDIFDNIKQKRSKAYRYIVFDNGISDNANVAIRNAKAIIAAAQDDPEVLERNAISILLLARNSDRSAHNLFTPRATTPSQIIASRLEYLPIPTDVVLYVRTLTDLSEPTSPRKTFAVMSVSPITATTPIIAVRKKIAANPWKFASFRQPKLGCDVRLELPEHYEPIMQWFEQRWSSEGGAH
jgi:hypothetical protein